MLFPSPGRQTLRCVAFPWHSVIKLTYDIALQRLRENLGAAKVTLTPEELEEVRKVANSADHAKGDRYPPQLAAVLFADTPLLE